MWQRFTERARRVVFYSQEEAGRLGENYVSTEHMLLGLVRENDSVAARILDQLGVSLGRIRSEIERVVTRGDGRLGQDMQLTPRCKRVIDLAYDEARQLSNSYIGTEHLLLGLIREGEGLAGRVLAKLGVDLERARKVVMEFQDTATSAATDAAAAVNVDRMPEFLAERVRQEALRHAAAAAHDETTVFSMTAVHNDTLGLRGKSLLSMADLTREQILGILQVTRSLETDHKERRMAFRWFYPRSLAMIFEKPSLRTRVTFDLGMQQLGGATVVLGPAEIGLGVRESVADVAHNLERMVDAIMARVFKHEILVELRDNAHVPVINGLSDREHPCQILADLYTVQQKRGTLEGVKLAWIGDGNNVLHSLLLGGALTGMTIAAACPPGYEPDAGIVEQARALAERSKIENRKSKIEIVAAPEEAVRDADAVYTDVWTSMGQEHEQLARIQAFRSYQVNAALMAHAKPDAIFMHCLPAHRGDEVTDEVVDGPQSVVFDQAENRLHAQKAVLALAIGL